MAKPEVIFMTVPALGHLFPTIEFAKHLLNSTSSVSITILTVPHIVPTWEAAAAPHVASCAAAGIRFEQLPLVPPPPRRPGEKLETFFIRFIASHSSHFRAVLARRLSAPIAAVIFDVLCATMIDIPRKLGVPAYFFSIYCAAMIALILRLPSGELGVPGQLPAMPWSAIPRFLVDEKGEAYEVFLDIGRGLREARELIINTFEQLEPVALKAIAGGDCTPENPAPLVLAVGPVAALGLEVGEGRVRECLEWLDGQPEASVVLLCFGSMGWFSPEQTKEMASALEQSGQRFLWVLRAPAPASSNNLPEDADIREAIPEGFVEGNKSRGLVWPTWAPQAKLLGHKSMGGFVTHCGWNSCLESICLGVPMLAWPLYAEQDFVAFQMTQHLGVALELRIDRERDNFVTAAEFELGLRRLMGEEGRRVREKVEEMRSAGQKAVAAGGRSTAAMGALVERLLRECPVIS